MNMLCAYVAVSGNTTFLIDLRRSWAINSASPQQQKAASLSYSKTMKDTLPQNSSDHPRAIRSARLAVVPPPRDSHLEP